MDQEKSKTGWKLFVFSAACILIACYGIAVRAKQAKDLGRETIENSITAVSTTHPKAGNGTEDIVLPGRVEAWHEASIYARTNGYIASWATDIGSHVKAGDVLAEIETPEIDAQLRQAEADLATAQANNLLSQSTAKRWKTLLKTDSVTKQEADEKSGDASAKTAAVAAAKANVDRLQELESFKHITAPFDGVITSRNIDIGALVNAGSGAQELFHIVEKDKLRVFVEVPQNYTQRLTSGMTAELHFSEYPGRVFRAALSHDASALDPATRTLRVEFTVDNDKEELLPGGYTEVHLQVAVQEDGMRLPVNTLLYRTKGVFVATVDNQNQIQIKPVTLGRDFGTEVEVTAGLTANEAVVVNPSDSLAQGTKVRIVALSAPSAKPTDPTSAGGKKS